MVAHPAAVATPQTPQGDTTIPRGRGRPRKDATGTGRISLKKEKEEDAGKGRLRNGGTRVAGKVEEGGKGSDEGRKKGENERMGREKERERQKGMKRVEEGGKRADKGRNNGEKGGKSERMERNRERERENGKRGRGREDDKRRERIIPKKEEEEKEEEEEDDFDFSVIEKKIFEGTEGGGRGRGRRDIKQEKGGRGRGGGGGGRGGGKKVKEEEKVEEKITKTPPSGKLEKKTKKEEEEERKGRGRGGGEKREEAMQQRGRRKRSVDKEEEEEEEERKKRRRKNVIKEKKMKELNKGSERKKIKEEEERRREGKRKEKEDRKSGRSGGEEGRRGGGGGGRGNIQKQGGRGRGGGRKEEDRGRTGRGRRGGGRGGGRPQKTPPPTTTASESELSDWEEVDEMEGVDEVEELLSKPSSSSSQPDGGGGVRIELDAPETLWGMKRRKKRRTEEELIEDYLRKRVNDTIRKVALNMHKTHLLCLLAHGRHLNTALGGGTVLGAALSTTPGRAAHPKGRLDLGHLQRLVEWFGKKFKRVKLDVETDYHRTAVDEVLVRRFGTQEVRSAKEAVLCFVALCRSLGISARLVLALQPMSWKPASGALIKPNKECQESAKGESASVGGKGGGGGGGDASSAPSTSSSSSSSSAQKMKIPNRKMLSSDSETSPIQEKRGKGRPVGGGGKRRKTTEKEEEEEEEEEDSDFKPQKMKYRRTSKQGKRRESQEEGRGGKKEEEGEGKKRRRAEGMEEWAEVFVEEEERWVCVDVGRMKIHCVTEIEARMPPGSAYITAFNPDLTLKDVTRRYVSSWLSAERKLRPCSDWWKASLRPFEGARGRKDKEEEEEMEKTLHLQPLPKTIAEYKNHPLYALQRHLLKFEAIYPPDVSPAGFFKSEPVYPRSSVHNLHSRETWLKEAKSVRVGEEPYKTVKARPKWDRVRCQVIKDIPLELFGDWQVEDYEPPVAADGKVPRNEYGNVEMYKPSMLPRGCVHIPVAGINKVARKLKIDCAPAMVGFDFHSGFTHPVYEGYVVCEEFKDVLMDAWNQEQEEQARRAEERREKKVYDNWRKLIKGLLVRERVRERYQCSSEEEEEEEEEEEGKRKKKKEETVKKRKIKQSDLDKLCEKEEKVEENVENGDKVEKNGGNRSTEVETNPSSTSSTAGKPPLITHHVKNLSIDLTSNVVEMAKRSRQKLMKSKNTAKRREKRRKEDVAGGGGGGGRVKEDQGGVQGLSEESEASDEELKKEKIRAILNWGTESKVKGPNLSDDSADEDDDDDSADDSTTPPNLDPPLNRFRGFTDQPKQPKQPKTKRKYAGRKSDSESEVESDASTSRSTTPEPVGASVEGTRRVSARTAKRKVTSYQEKKKKKEEEEEEEEEEEDLSDDESDFEDKSYIPEKVK
ncbi:DNA repair protein complementing XP-C cells homolog [Eriocheir sinensis]|uniref:DNA repair protein complementing XP-C cells homolog n=1 Tax=Eriocheir sinensis TaxID=95602 RepID=UPI0021C9173B|nr:DNA repair protein complementing XP-C cells homolog [Eriocheir sinensis]XP_050739958.1 DNA repair protein complementing XP-C cells homolog [Eriocheir sinensis]XP_050739959.1 DNA repair protein complementing XP-C cells homolog [Eriocheir sinensis]